MDLTTYAFGRAPVETREFLTRNDLDFDEGVDFTVNMLGDDGEISATGSLRDNVIKCVAVDQTYQGEGLAAVIVGELVKKAAANGRTHLFVYTKPKNEALFTSLGFYVIAVTDKVLFLENRKNGITDFVRSIHCPSASGTVGALVANCNPCTNGHLYLMESAAAQCDFLYIFILTEDLSDFPTGVRLKLVRESAAHIKNAVVCGTSDYLISAKTFPDYFIKEKETVAGIGGKLDLTIFCRYFVRELNIKKRFAGTEPYCSVTNAYNTLMREMLAKNNVDFVELDRLKSGEDSISASYVRKLLARGDMEAVAGIVPRATMAFLESQDGQKIIEKLRAKYIE